MVSRVRRIARYLAKYITKDLISEFNRKRYWQSSSISLESARVYWLDSISQVEAIAEACGILGVSLSSNPFIPSERVAWWSLDPSPGPQN
jgi:hypothetical protein